MCGSVWMMNLKWCEDQLKWVEDQLDMGRRSSSSSVKISLKWGKDQLEVCEDN
jgi:hypothetical protein